MKLKPAIFTVLTLSLTATLGAESAQAALLTPVLTGVSNARAVSFGPDGTLYLAEPGIGGDGKCQESPSTLFAPICAGNSGSIVRLKTNGEVDRIFTNFQSLAEQPLGTQGAGPSSLQFDASGNAYLLTGFAGYPGNRDLELNTIGRNFPLPPQQLAIFPPAAPDQVLNTPNLAKLFKADLTTGALTEIFDFGRYEIINNPDGGDVVSNPYDLAIRGDKAYVTDGGGNAAYVINLDGSGVKAIAIPRNIVTNPILPPLPPGFELPPGLLQFLPPDETGAPRLAVQSVPTGGAIGPDGAFYVGEYSGFPYQKGISRIFRIDEDGVPKVFAENFTQITGLAFDPAGNLLVLQFSDLPQPNGDISALPGSLIQLAPDGTRTTLVAAGEGLKSADGIAVGPDGNIYITNRAIGPNQGEVLRLERRKSVPEPTATAGLVASGLGGWLLARKRRQQAVNN